MQLIISWSESDPDSIIDTIGYDNTQFLANLNGNNPRPVGRVTDSTLWANRGFASVGTTRDIANFKFGRASRYFGGTTLLSAATIPLGANVLDGPGRWSYELFFRPTALSANPGILFCVRDVSAGFNSAQQILYALGLKSSGKIVFMQSTSAHVVSGNGGTYAEINSDTVLAVDTWHHARIVETGAVIYLYVNGVLQGSTPYLRTAPGARTFLYFGAYDGSNNGQFIGQLDEVRVCSGAPNITDFTVPTAEFSEFARFERWNEAIGSTATSSDRVLTQGSGAAAMSGLGRCLLPTTGKWYWEVEVASSGALLAGVGIAATDDGYDVVGARSNAATSFCAGVTRAAQVTWAAGRLMIAYDADAAKMWVGRAGTWFSSGNPGAGTAPYYSAIPSGINYHPWVHGDNNGQIHTHTLCLSSGNIAHSIPSGFSLLV